MAYDEALAERIRDELTGLDVVEKKMFGGLAFMVDGHMAVGLLGSDEGMMVRVAREDYDATLARPHAHAMEMTGRAMLGFVVVAPAGIEDQADLRDWIDRGVDFVRTLPPKD